MARVPIKSCPNLSRLFEAAEPSLIAGFLNCRSFDRFDWLKTYTAVHGDEATNDRAIQMLAKEPKEKLKPLETEAARVVTMATGRGQFALEGVAGTKLAADRLRVQSGQRDELARSLWTFVFESMLFEAAENSLHMRLYRRYDRHYQTFMAKPSLGPDLAAEEDLLPRFLQEIETTLRRGSGYSIDRFDIPADDGEPAAELYVLFHPNLATSIRDMDDEGNRARIYFRPPGEAMIVYFPSTGRVHVRADTRVLRHKISDTFITEVLNQPLSSQPVDFQAYDISQFRSNFAPIRPEFDDVVISSAKVIRIEVSIENLASRLSVSTSADGDIGALIEGQQSLGEIFERAIATRLVEFAVEYRRKDRDDQRRLNFTVTDRNTCSLLSVEDPFERVLGHRLLRAWGIASEGRAPEEKDSTRVLSALLELWEIGREWVSGAWLAGRRIDPGLLTEIGFLVPGGADEGETEDVIDDEDSVGQVGAEVVQRSFGQTLRLSPGQESPAGAQEMYRVYRVREGWVAQHLRTYLAEIFGDTAPVLLDADLVALGTISIEGRDVPVYLARGLGDETTREAIDAQLSARKERGVGLVLQAGKAPGASLAGNVLTPLADHLSGTLPDITLDLGSLRKAYLLHHVQAEGGQAVEFQPIDETAGTLFVPGKGSIYIRGEHRVRLIEMLVRAHNAGQPAVSSEKLRKGISDQSLSNIFGNDLWKRLQDGFVRQPKRPYWEIAADPNSAPTPFTKSD